MGLFGRVEGVNYGLGGELRDIGLNRVRIRGRHGVGALVGDNWGVIRHSYAEGEVSASYLVGGLVGYNVGDIYDSFAAVAVQSTTTTNGQADAGGLVGVNYGSIGRSYASGKVEGVLGAVGGLVGYQSSSSARIFDSYASGEVYSEGVGYYDAAGGLVGFRIGGTLRGS